MYSSWVFTKWTLLPPPHPRLGTLSITDLVHNLASPFTICITWGKLFSLSEHPFSHLSTAFHQYLWSIKDNIYNLLGLLQSQESFCKRIPPKWIQCVMLSNSSLVSADVVNNMDYWRRLAKGFPTSHSAATDFGSFSSKAHLRNLTRSRLKVHPVYLFIYTLLHPRKGL